MAEEALEGETRRREEAEARLGVATVALEKAAEEVERREVEEAPRRAEEGERSEVQRLAAERRIEDLERMEAELRQEAEIRRP